MSGFFCYYFHMFDEKEILEFWKKNKAFEKSVNQRKPYFAKASRGKQNHFVFFEGPPTANGVPGVHHVESRACCFKIQNNEGILRAAPRGVGYSRASG